MNYKIIALVGVGSVLVAAAAGAQLMRKGYDEPKHTVVVQSGNFEIRVYEPRIVAETRVSTEDWQKGVSTGFGRLAGFIFGDNKSKSGESTKIAMTTPVESIPDGDSHVVVFTMPKKHTMADLPAPNDDRVTIRELPESTMAALQFSGQARRQNLDSLKAELMKQVEAAGYTVESEVKIAQYDPPWVAGPFRRNELMVDVKKVSDAK